MDTWTPLDPPLITVRQSNHTLYFTGSNKVSSSSSSCITLVAVVDYWLCLCLSVCLCVPAIAAPHSNAKSQPQ